ncbi:MAG TPA: response regulator [Urbifossiella sp.]|nr:response regulator [Urbifossiella sp.]
MNTLSVLVVDDHRDTAASTAELCRLFGYAVRYAVCADDAVALAVAHPPDVILLDLMMPRVDGFELSRRLAAAGNGRPPVLVAHTGCETDGDRAASRAAGFHLHLVKPVAPATLSGVLRRFQEALVADVPSCEPVG